VFLAIIKAVLLQRRVVLFGSPAVRASHRPSSQP
jgi:hypothetical protein